MSSQKLKIYFSIHNNENMLRQIQVQALRARILVGFNNITI